MLKRELIDGLAATVEAQRGTVFTEANTNSLLEALAMAKAAIPSGQAAEDLARLHKRLETHDDHAHAAADRLAAQAQSAEHYADALEEEKNQHHRTMGGLGSALAECEALREKIARLSAAGRVISEHVGRAPEWTLRDEFAKAAMLGLTIAGGNVLKREAIVSAAYMMADTMLAARSDAVDITPEQEKAWEIEARKDAAEQMRAACLAAVIKVYGACSGCVSINDLTEAIQQAKP